MNDPIRQVAATSLTLLAFSLAACAPSADTLRDNKASRAASATGSPAERVSARNPYSPRILNDRYVLDQQRATAEALRRSCAQTGEHCALAKEASRYLDEQAAGR